MRGLLRFVKSNFKDYPMKKTIKPALFLLMLITFIAPAAAQLRKDTIVSVDAAWFSCGFSDPDLSIGVSSFMHIRHKNHLLLLGYHDLLEQAPSSFFDPGTPLKIVNSQSITAGYGFCLGTRYVKLIPSCAIGWAHATWRSNEKVPQQSGQGGFLNFSSGGPDYKLEYLTGPTLTPQIQLLLHGKYTGIGLSYMKQFIFSNARTCSDHHIILSLSAGLFR